MKTSKVEPYASPTTEGFEIYSKSVEEVKKFRLLAKHSRLKSVLKVFDTLAAILGYSGLILQYYIVRHM